MNDMIKILLETYQGTLKWPNPKLVGSDLEQNFSTSLLGALLGAPHMPSSRVKKKLLKTCLDTLGDDSWWLEQI